MPEGPCLGLAPDPELVLPPTGMVRWVTWSIREVAAQDLDHELARGRQGCLDNFPAGGYTGAERMVVAVDLNEQRTTLHAKHGAVGIDTELVTTVTDRGYVVANLYQEHTREDGTRSRDHVMLFDDDIDQLLLELQVARNTGNERKAKNSA